MLGTGTPGPDPDRSGPATAIVANATPYLVDFGPGVVRRAKAAVIEKGVKALEPINLRVAFATHLHSDHTVGYPDLILTPWVIGRRVPLEVYGPKGIKAMTQHILAAYDEDIKARTRPDGNQHGFPQGSWANAHEIATGVVYKCRAADMPWRATAIGSTLPIVVSSSRGTQRQRKRPSMRAMAATF